ncbi:hypothetical protein FisN_3Lh587 [Fistulifera solaris]|uniref:DUF819 domain-containing protein n=1 Tax=Fistulifera solaris TaxID=1519565 RepID=A0A1Z5J905_FISSO|nr:hypothetical protein FisN_3Lh587 [Fistulifera solaris]|eukprot:GAX10372.1 hypothetical protein FisN_3Lh587 [Fistulifera solaris]
MLLLPFLLLGMSVASGSAFVLPQTLLAMPITRSLPTRLQSLLTPTTATAATALTSSALMGMWMERQNPNSGILTSLMVSSLVFSRMAPAHHFLYDRCWDTFLPASLALLFMGMPQSNQDINQREETIDISHRKEHHSIRTVVRRLAGPFMLASMGSLIGCTTAFFVCRGMFCSSDAAWAGACLSASFVGGSVNFLATAAWIASQRGESVTTLVSAMTAADLIVMAIYFAIMAAATQSVSLERWFQRKNSHQDNLVDPTRTATSSASDENASYSTVTSALSTFHVPTALLITTIALALVRVGQKVELLCSAYIPGMACAFLAAVTPGIRRYLPSQAAATAPPLSQFCFLLLFAAVGVTADLQAALQSGPSCIIFATVALLLHGVVLMVGGRYLLAGRSKLMDCLIASNAAIGGPATAATFCGTLPNNTQALTIAATIWGVFGYAIGTTVGVGMYRFLSMFT